MGLREISLTAFFLVSSQIAISGVPPLSLDTSPTIASHLPKEAIQVTADYHGERLLIYGVVSPDCEVVVKLTSPAAAVTYSQKGRVGIFWFAVGTVSFNNVPWMFKIKSSGPLDQILLPEEQIRHQIGRKGLIASIESATPNSSPFQIDEMIQVRADDQLYSFHEGQIKRMKGNLFETSFFWPPKAPAGTYRIDSFAIREKKVITIDSELVRVEKVGVEAWISQLALEHGVLYGIVAVIIAQTSGLMVGLIFRGIGPGRRRIARTVR